MMKWENETAERLIPENRLAHGYFQNTKVSLIQYPKYIYPYVQ
jgi:hypothetical protein